MLQDQVIPIDFGQGVDTKTDEKGVVAGKFLRLENGVFTKAKRIAKRNGYDALTGVTAPKLVHGYKDELLCAENGLLKSYSPSESAWISRGSFISTELSRAVVDQTYPGSGYVDSAVLGNYTLYAWSTAVQSTASFGLVYSNVLASVVDNQTGATLIGPSVLSNASTTSLINPVRCVLLGGSTLALIYVNSTATAIVMRRVTFSGLGVVSFGAEQTISTNLNSSYWQFDVVATATGAALAYYSTTGLTVAIIDTAGTVAASVNILDADTYGPISISTTTNGNIWIYWCDATLAAGVPTAQSIVYAVYSSALASVLSKTTVVTQNAPYIVTNMIAVSTSATAQTLYYGELVTTSTSGGVSTYADRTYYVTTTSTGTVGSDTFFANGVLPYSRPITVSSTNYALFLYRTATLNGVSVYNPPFEQATFFMLRLSNADTVPLTVARFAAGAASSQATLKNQVLFTPQLCALSSSKVLGAVGVQTQSFNSATFVAQGFFPGGLTAQYAYTIDFDGENAYNALNCAELAVFNGGLVQAYDGNKPTELNFHVYPEIVLCEPVNSVAPAGAIAAGAYQYLAIFQWTDAQGNLHQSTPSEAVSVTLGGGVNAVNVTVSTAYLTQKTNVSVALFRTQASGTVFYQVNNPVLITSADPSAAAITILDVYSDAQIAGNPQAYTYPASSVLENSAPPPSMALLSHNNRLWLVDAEEPSTIYYTKSFQQAVGLSPSALLFQQIDPKYGNIVGLAEMDEKLVLGKQKGFFVVAGDGANDTGTGQTLSFPQIIPSDVGVKNMKSVVTMPMGVMFKSENGIYMLDRKLNVSYIGAEVEAYNSQTITAATLIPGKTQIRFLCSSGLTLVYDYLFNQWGTFTNHTGNSATVWNNTYVYSTSTLVLREAAGSYLDNGTSFKLLARTSWLALASVQGFQRVRRLAMLGDFVNGASSSHAMQVSAAYDFNETFQPAIPYAFGAVSGSGAFQYRERLPIQKCGSISLLIEELPTGDSLEYIDFTNISFEAAVKKGLNKLPGARTVG